jgi:GNAT superfamily N-acetyltransferase
LAAGPSARVRPALREDVAGIVGLLADDAIGATREDARDPLPGEYYAAFVEIDRDPNQELVVLDVAGRVAGTLQLTIIPNLTYRGGRRALIEGVRVSREDRGAKQGARLVLWAIARARERGCHLVQLTTDKRRPEAITFYERLGFAATHEGMKLWLR